MEGTNQIAPSADAAWENKLATIKKLMKKVILAFIFTPDVKILIRVTLFEAAIPTLASPLLCMGRANG